MTPADVTVLPEAPFRGIESFRYVDHDIFFARRPQILTLLQRVVVYRGSMLFGDTGTGKSSLVNAGLIHEMIREGYAPERLRVQARRSEEIVVERLLVSEDPEVYLPSTLVSEDGTPRAVLSVGGLRDRLADRDPARPPLLIFDQFEELVTLFEEARSPRKRDERKASQRAILELIDELLIDESRRLKLLFVFREDYLAKVVELLGSHPELVQQSVRLVSPTAAAVQMIVRGPFERFPDHFKPELSDDVARQLTQAMDERSAGGSINLSELQIVCRRLWKLDMADGVQLDADGVQRILEAELSEALDRFEPERRYAAVTLLSRMITASGARNVVSEEDLLGHVESEDGIPKRDLREALEALRTDARLIRREIRHEVPFYEITSEFLAPWIRRQREGLRDRALWPAKTRWERDLRSAQTALAGEDDAERKRAVDQLVGLMFQTKDLDPVLYLKARAALNEPRDNASLGVLKKVEQASRWVRLMEDEDDDTPLLGPSTHVLRYAVRGTPAEPRPQSRGRLLLASAFMVALSMVSAFAFAWALDLVGFPQGGPPGYWPLLAFLVGATWAVLYIFETLDSLGLDGSIFTAPFHPYEYGVDPSEISAGWPINFLLGWSAAALVAAAGHAWLGLDTDTVFTITLGAGTVVGIGAYNEAVSLF